MFFMASAFSPEQEKSFLCALEVERMQTIGISQIKFKGVICRGLHPEEGHVVAKRVILQLPAFIYSCMWIMVVKIDRYTPWGEYAEPNIVNLVESVEKFESRVISYNCVFQATEFSI